jgi:hypothetical protein
MRNLLHDHIDQHEALRDEAMSRVDAVKSQIGDISGKSINFKTILTECAARLGNELADVTTKAVKIGLSQAKGRSEKLRDKNKRQA